MNDVQRVIRDRRSHRKYTDQSISEEMIARLIEAATASPTGRNLQAYHFTFVTNREIINEVEGAACEVIKANSDTARISLMASRNWKIFYNAPLCVFISADPDARWAQIDSGIAIQNLALEAESLGLGSVIIGMIESAFQSDKKQRLQELLQFPEGYEFAIAIGIGYPDDEKPAHEIKPNTVSMVK